jgi:ornithine carbamoyltransferase
MAVRHVLSIRDLSPAEVQSLVDDSAAIARGRWEGRRPLEGRVVGLYFKKTSTRTRTSFTVGAQKLGATTISYGPDDLQTNTGETVRDTGRVLAGYLDALVVRTNESVDEMRELASTDYMAVVNAMSAQEHPTQAIADLSAMKEAFGQLTELHVLYMGDGNNTLASLALAMAMMPRMRLTMVTPRGYELPAATMRQLKQTASENGSVVEQAESMDRLPKVDVVYTARWTTMGVGKTEPGWQKKFEPVSVTESLMGRVSKDSTVFMHDLPAMRGQEVTNEVLDGPQSIAFRQAFHKLSSAMAILNWCVGRG